MAITGKQRPGATRREAPIAIPRLGVRESLEAPGVAARRVPVPPSSTAEALSRLLGSAGGLVASVGAVAEQLSGRQREEQLREMEEVLGRGERHAPAYWRRDVQDLFYRNLGFREASLFDPSSLEIQGDETPVEAFWRWFKQEHGEMPPAYQAAYVRYAMPRLGAFQSQQAELQRRQLYQEALRDTLNRLAESDDPAAELSNDLPALAAMAKQFGIQEGQLQAQIAADLANRYIAAGDTEKLRAILDLLPVGQRITALQNAKTQQLGELARKAESAEQVEQAEIAVNQAADAGDIDEHQARQLLTQLRVRRNMLQSERAAELENQLFTPFVQGTATPELVSQALDRIRNWQAEGLVDAPTAIAWGDRVRRFLEEDVDYQNVLAKLDAEGRKGYVSRGEESAFLRAMAAQGALAISRSGQTVRLLDVTDAARAATLMRQGGRIPTAVRDWISQGLAGEQAEPLARAAGLALALRRAAPDLTNASLGGLRGKAKIRWLAIQYYLSNDPNMSSLSEDQLREIAEMKLPELTKQQFYGLLLNDVGRLENLSETASLAVAAREFRDQVAQRLPDWLKETQHWFKRYMPFIGDPDEFVDWIPADILNEELLGGYDQYRVLRALDVPEEMAVRQTFSAIMRNIFAKHPIVVWPPVGYERIGTWIDGGPPTTPETGQRIYDDLVAAYGEEVAEQVARDTYPAWSEQLGAYILRQPDGQPLRLPDGRVFTSPRGDRERLLPESATPEASPEELGEYAPLLGPSYQPPESEGGRRPQPAAENPELNEEATAWRTISEPW